MPSTPVIRTLPPFLVLLLAAGPLQADDAVVGMCLDLGKSGTVCDCAAEALREEVGETDYALYESVGSVYRQNQQAGQDASAAWSAALNSVGARLRDTNPLGAAHRKAVRSCAS